MKRSRKPYKTFPREFKLEAVRLMQESDRPAAEIAAELDIRRNQLYKWKAQLEAKGENAFPGKPGRPKKEDQGELATLQQENKRLKEEIEILKKAAAYFARDLK